MPIKKADLNMRSAFLILIDANLTNKLTAHRPTQEQPLALKVSAFLRYKQR